MNNKIELLKIYWKQSGMMKNIIDMFIEKVFRSKVECTRDKSSVYRLEIVHLYTLYDYLLL